MSLTNPKISLIIRLLIAHMVSDYFLQFSSWTRYKEINKIKSKKLYWHILITFWAAWLFSLSFLGALLIAVSHYIIDLGKMYIKINRFVLFVLDQFLHTLMLVLTWLLIINGWSWLFHETSLFLASTENWILIFAYGVITFPLSVVINIFTDKWRSQLEPDRQESLKKAGLWIGVFERILILTFILTNQFSTMGFLIATKAILRFKDTETKQMEYVLIGTLMSITPTILLGIIVNYLLNSI